MRRRVNTLLTGTMGYGSVGSGIRTRRDCRRPLGQEPPHDSFHVISLSVRRLDVNRWKNEMTSAQFQRQDAAPLAGLAPFVCFDFWPSVKAGCCQDAILPKLQPARKSIQENPQQRIDARKKQSGSRIGR